MIEIIPDTRNKQIEFQLKNAKVHMLKYIRTALFEIGAENTQLIKKYIYRPPKTGRFYRYYYSPGKFRWHQASAPGESPANRSGKLARSITYNVHGSLEVELVSTLDEKYPKYLEDGTPGGLIKPRPYFLRAVNAKRRDNKRSLIRHVYNNIRR